MYLSHPLRIALCQIVIDRNDLYAFSCQGIQVCGTGRYQRLTFTGTHLSDTSLMKHNTADQLYREMLHIERSLCSFPNGGKCLRQKVIQRLTLCQPLPEDPGLIAQFLV